ncbi:hypothetical protein WDU94_012779 [Cyamophila willieti]
MKNRYEDTALVLFKESKSKRPTAQNNDLFHYGETSKRSAYETVSNGTLYVKRLNGQHNVNTNTSLEITTVSIMSDKNLRCSIM